MGGRVGEGVQMLQPDPSELRDEAMPVLDPGISREPVGFRYMVEPAVLVIARKVDRLLAAGSGQVFRQEIGVAQIGLDAIRQLLEYRGGRSAAPWASDHHGRELAQTHRLQNLLRDDDFPSSVATGFWRK